MNSTMKEKYQAKERQNRFNWYVYKASRQLDRDIIEAKWEIAPFGSTAWQLRMARMSAQALLTLEIHKETRPSNKLANIFRS